MSNIERFIRDNREGFDNLEPSRNVWDTIESQLGTTVQKKTPVVKMMWLKVSVAAALFIAITGTAIYLFNHKEDTTIPQVAQKTDQPKADSNKSAGVESNDPVVEDIDPQYGKMVAQFTSLIETKQGEIRAIEKDNPTLYHQFSGDIKKLDSAYQVLRNTLPANPNKEQLLQAMIQNLQMQIDLLNQQLLIIQKMKQSKIQKI